MSRRIRPRLMPFGLALLSCFMVCAAPGAGADPRFGDSTWVAPGALDPDDSTSAAARVAAPDHARAWETALRMPSRIAFFPLRVVAWGMEGAASRLGDRIHDRQQSGPPRQGLSVGPAFDLGGVTDIGIGPAIKWAGFPLAGAKLGLSGTWSTIDRRRVKFSGTTRDRRPVGARLSVVYDRKPDHKYFGIGNDAPKTDLSYFLLESTDLRALLLLGASPLRQLRLIGGYSSMGPRRGYHRTPLLEDVFPAGVPYERTATQEYVYGLAGDFATLDDVKDPSLGVHGRFELIHGAGPRDRDPDYNQWRLEGRAYVPVFAKRRVIALRLVYAGIDPTGASTVPFYRLMSTAKTLRFAGYATDRFRDRQLAIARGEYRWTLVQRVSAVALYELGAVAPDASAFTLSSAHVSYGGGLRLGLREGAAARVEAAKSVEGLEVTLELGSDF